MTVDEIKHAVEHARTLLAVVQVTGLGGANVEPQLNAARALVALHDLVELYVRSEDEYGKCDLRSAEAARERIYERLYQVVLP